MSELSTLVNILSDRVQEKPDREIFIFLQDGEQKTDSLTYLKLETRAKAIATYLQETITQGAHALLIFSPGIEFITAFFGCLYAGIVAVPIPLPHKRKLSRVKSVLADSQAAAILTTENLLGDLKSKLLEDSLFSTLQWIAVDRIDDRLASPWQKPEIGLSTLALLQYTSGSTGNPKGVTISHGNLLSNSHTIRESFNNNSKTSGVIWLPPYHDMGLIGGIVQPIYSDSLSILMPPQAFLQKPIRWLQTITRYKATISGGPDFAYDLCTSKISPEQMTELDLSTWNVAFNGAEPICYKTLETFAEKFKSCGFKKDAFYPCYGLAEATLIVSGRTVASPLKVLALSKDGIKNNQALTVSPGEVPFQEIVSCGKIQGDCQVLIVDPDELIECPPGKIGEIWVSGSSIAKGYWNKPEETLQEFQAYLSDNLSEPYLRTGDMGFVHEDELYITGRIKDIIIIRGQNYYPQDIERTVENSHQALQKNCGAVFSIDEDGEQQLIVTQEINRKYWHNVDFDEIIAAIRQAIFEEHGLHSHAVLLLAPGSIPKTSSGKIQRHLCQSKFLAGELQVSGSFVNSLELREPASYRQGHNHSYLQQIIADVLQINELAIPLDKPLTAIGIDSLKALQVIGRIQDVVGVELPLECLFDSRTVIDLQAYIESKKAIIDETKKILRLPITPVVARTKDLPASFSQMRLWFLYQFDKSSTAYNVPLAFQITGSLNIPALELAINEVVERHEALRTTFREIDNSLVQLITPNSNISIVKTDLTQLPNKEQVAELQRLLNYEIEQVFKLSDAPPLKASVFKLNQDSYIVLFVMHHIIIDGWSQGVFLKELSTLYAAYSIKATPSLPNLSVQYADFAQWQIQQYNSSSFDTNLQYWCQQLADIPKLLNLPTDKPRPPVRSTRGFTYRFALGLNLTQKLKTISDDTGTTLYMVLLTIFSILLSRYSHQEDIVIGSPSAGRNHQEIESLIGFFVNILILRIDVSGNPTFRDLLMRVRHTCLEAYTYQDVPHEKLVETIQPERSLSYTPLFQVMFVLQNAPTEKLELPSLDVTPLKVDTSTSKFDLVLSMAEEEQELVGEWEASSDLFLPETISRMSNHFKILVEGIVNNFQEKISKLPLCTWHEEQWLVNELNQNQTPYPKNTTIPQQFEFQVKRSPEKVAVVFNNQSLTYSELNARGDRLAAYLQALGVGPETLVGICVEKSLEMIVGLLGILKAGAAYVPLDASYPQERISFMLSDADIRIVLTQDSLSELLNSELLNNELYLILLETFTEEFESYKTTPEVIPSLTSLTYKSYQELTPDNLAYVMYTSGTTGIPKGVCVTHQNVIRLIRETNYANFDESLVFLQLASISFDASTFEIWGALLNGAKLAIANTQTPSLKDLGESIRHHGITTLWLTSGLFQLVVDEILDDLEPVRQLLAGGDVLSVQHVRKFVSTYPDCQLINGYGPTENTTFTCCYTVQDSKYLNRKSIPIGRPIANSEVYICDREMQLAPIGVPGELYVGGDGLARGYLNRPDLTEEKFVSNVLSGVVGKRLYKTGDLARYLPDGNIEFLGRLDRQVKIRGFRIEPEEIEFALMEYSGVKSAVVIDREDIPGDKRLVAYVVSQEELTGGDLRRFLKSKLPSYAIPSAFVFLKALPLTPNGKIDRSLLPAPEISHKHEGKVVTPPRSSMEKALTTIWTEVLKVEEIGIHDNFFDLGGHSLLSIQLIAHIRTHLSLELPLKCIFENPTIAELAEYIETVDWLNQNNTETLNRSEFEIGKL